MIIGYNKEFSLNSLLIIVLNSKRIEASIDDS